MTKRDVIDVLVAAIPEAKRFAHHAAVEIRRIVRSEHAEEAIVDNDTGGITFRIKTREAMQAKLSRRASGYPRGLPINDFIGIRILCLHIGCIPLLERVIYAWAAQSSLVLARREDTTRAPREAGYRAVHLDYILEPNIQDKLPRESTIQVQLESWLQHLHNVLNRHLVYARDPEKVASTIARLVDMSAELHRVDCDLAGEWRVPLLGFK